MSAVECLAEKGVAVGLPLKEATEDKYGGFGIIGSFAEPCE